MFIVVAAITYWLIRFLAPRVRAWIAGRETEPAMIALRIPMAGPVKTQADTLCNYCVYAHIVRGYGMGEEMIACGYMFPAREVLFRCVNAPTTDRSVNATAWKSRPREQCVSCPSMKRQLISTR